MQDQRTSSGAAANTVGVAVIVAIVTALVVGGGVWVLRGGGDESADALATAQDKIAQLEKTTQLLEQQVSDAADANEKILARLKHQKQAHQKAEDQLAAETSTDLADGRYPVDVKAADATAGNESLTVDVIQFYTGDAANKAAKADGAETPVPNDIYTRNESTKLRTLPVDPGATATVLHWHRDFITEGKPVSFASFANIMNGGADWQHYNQDGIYWITLDGGSISRIEAQYTP